MQKLQIFIPEPCHENWHHMTPTEQGRFCNSCAKEVVDFSMMTDIEVLKYFTSTSNDKVCGRTLPTQLNRTISWPKEPKKKLFWYWNYIMMFFMFFTKTNTSKAQVKQGTEQTPVIPRDHLMVGEVAVNKSRVITGKVTDINGNPIPFASVDIKGITSGISADANGAFSIRLRPESKLIFSAAGYKTAEIPVGNQPFISIALETGNLSELKEVVVTVAGGIMRRDFYDKADLKYTASFQIKDDKSGLPINKAKIIAAKANTKDTIIAFTDKNGSYKLKSIKRREDYFIKVEAVGYEANEFTISEEDFNDRKKIWEVLLTKQKTKPDETIIIRLGQLSVDKVFKRPLYVVDGKIVTDGSEVHPDDIEEIKTLQSAEAMAIFGPGGSVGAIIVSTRKSKVKNLDTATVSASQTQGLLKTVRTCTTSVMGDTIITVQVKNSTADSIQTIISKISGNIKIYPNPVERGYTLNVYLKLKQTGDHTIQIADVAGRIISQEQFKATANEHKESIHTWLRWAAGVYYIRVFDNKNQLIGKKSFIVQ